MSIREEEPIEVFPLTEQGQVAPTPPGAAAPDRLRMALATAAVLGALALGVTAWATVQRLAVDRRQACVVQAQVVSYGVFTGGEAEADARESDLRRAVEDCGVDLPPPTDPEP